ncbi:hypothetical protein BDW59DRAFT_177366 [Aspergillus cavernicola]|uniref:Rhodopsin domain-containing protein n=1 Tax=Aspergillus cavernicola TaxID=176166 RepID=A0ABR4HNX9_9EURO
MDLATTPGMQPPEGQTSDFNAPHNSLQIGTIIAFSITYFLAAVCLGLRYFQAFKLIQKIELDLVIITISYGLALTYFVTMVTLMNQGWGKHMWDALLPNTLTYLVCPAVTKWAILSVLYRINPSNIYRYGVIAVAVMIFGYTLTLCIITGGPCSPLKDGTLKCLENVALSGAVMNIASDLAVVAFPIPTIHNLQLSLKQKLTVGCLLALGSGVIICSIARLPYVLLLRSNADSTYTQAILGVRSIIEVNLGIICACAMCFKRLIATYLPRLSIFTSSHSRSRSRGNKRKPGYESSDANGFRPENSRGHHSYQLHSIQNGNRSDTEERFATGKDISVYRSFKVDVEGTRTGSQETERDLGDGRSVDNILT